MHPGVKIAIAVALLGGVIYALTPGAESTAHERPALLPAAQAHDGTGERFGNAWWSEAAPCPDGAVLRGAPPPDGRDVWCALPDGTRHGPHTAWWPNGRQHFQRNYAHGRLDGPWQKWRPDGRRWAAGAYREGVRTGRWVEWSDLDRAKVTDYP